VQNLGLVCTVDLFPVPGPTDSPRGKDLKDSPTRRTVAAPCNQTPYSSSLPQSPPYPQQEPHQQQSFKFVTSNPYSTTSQQPQSPPGSRPFSTAHITSAAAGFLPPSSSADIVHHLGDFPVTESSKLTHALVGATFVQPANVDYQGKKALMFVFAVRSELQQNKHIPSKTDELLGSSCENRGHVHPSISHVRYFLTVFWDPRPRHTSGVLRGDVPSLLNKRISWLASIDRSDQGSFVSTPETFFFCLTISLLASNSRDGVSVSTSAKQNASAGKKAIDVAHPPHSVMATTTLRKGSLQTTEVETIDLDYFFALP
jgi:hypothetical protein